jgi:hypothetical protein
MKSIQHEIDELTEAATLNRVLEVEFAKVRARLRTLGNTAEGRINFDGLAEHEKEVLRQTFPNLYDAELRRLTKADLVAPAAEFERLAQAALEREQVKLGQIRDEGKPLFDRIRSRSPRGTGRDTVVKRAGGLDELTRAAPTSNELDVDHIYPLVHMVQLKGYIDLPLELQVSIANDPLVLLSVDRSLNRSRGERLWSSDWARRGEYSAEALGRAVDHEERALAHIRKRIDERQ